MNAGLLVEIVVPNGEASKAREDEERLEVTHQVSTDGDIIECRAYDFFLIFRRLFVDLVLNSKQRMMSRAFFLEHSDDKDPSKAFQIIELELNFIYDMVYTKAPIAFTRVGWVLRCICSGCIISALVIFFLHDKRCITRVDVHITYALLLGGLALDMAALSMLLFSDRASVFLQRSGRLRWLERLPRVAAELLRRRQCWSESVAQFNLISYASGRPYHYKGRFFLKVAKMLRAEEALEDFIFVQHVPLPHYNRSIISFWEPDDILRRVFSLLREAAQQLGDQDEEIAKVFNSRGDLALKHLEREIKSFDYGEGKKGGEERFKLIMDSVVKIMEFDESLLLWHIATDLCCCAQREMEGTEWEWVTPIGPATEDTTRMRGMGQTLSEYMMYLLIKQPEMLSARTGIWLMRYQDTCAEARHFFESMDSWIYGHEDARRALLAVNTSARPVDVKGDESKSVLFDACTLAKTLRVLPEELMWQVVSEVWVEMLMHAARKCPGSTHVRQLNRGGELITIVWFLMEHFGLGNVYDTTKGGSMARILVHDQ